MPYLLENLLFFKKITKKLTNFIAFFSVFLQKIFIVKLQYMSNFLPLKKCVFFKKKLKKTCNFFKKYR